MSRVAYPVKVSGSEAVVGCFVSSRDMPELFAHGEDVSAALLNASRALGRLFRRYQNEGRAVPTPKHAEMGEWLIFANG